LAEKDKYRKGIEIYFLASHPDWRWRKEAKERWLKERGIQARPSKARNDHYMAITTEARKENARLNLQMRRYHHALDDLEPILLKEGSDAAQAWALKGESYRLMAENPWAVKEELSPDSAAWRALKDLKEEEKVEKWRKEAQEAYTQAIRLDSQGADAYRGLGLLLAAQEDLPEAISHLERYLALAPEAEDRRFVTHQIEQVKKKLEEEKTRKETST
jgi:tetratricopeptide (TPR) repeat protein